MKSGRSIRAGVLGGMLVAASALGSAHAATPPSATSSNRTIGGARITNPEVKGPPLAITHVTVLPMTGDESPEKDVTVILRDAHIQAIGPSAVLRVPSGIRVIDGTGKYLMPSLTDMHVHPENDPTTHRGSSTRTVLSTRP